MQYIIRNNFGQCHERILELVKTPHLVVVVPGAGIFLPSFMIQTNLHTALSSGSRKLDMFKKFFIKRPRKQEQEVSIWTLWQSRTGKKSGNSWGYSLNHRALCSERECSKINISLGKMKKWTCIQLFNMIHWTYISGSSIISGHSAKESLRSENHIERAGDVLGVKD